MDTYYDVENTNTGGMIVNVTEKKGDDTKTFVKKFTRFTEGLDYINKSRFHEAFDALNNLGWSYANRGKDISIEMFSPCGENLFVFVPNVTFDYTKIEAIEIINLNCSMIILMLIITLLKNSFTIIVVPSTIILMIIITLLKNTNQQISRNILMI